VLRKSSTYTGLRFLSGVSFYVFATQNSLAIDVTCSPNNTVANLNEIKSKGGGVFPTVL